MIFDTSPSQSANWIRTSSALAGLAAIILIQSEAANAQTVPNLVGTWKGSAQAVFLGSNPYRPNRNAGANYSQTSGSLRSSSRSRTTIASAANQPMARERKN